MALFKAVVRALIFNILHYPLLHLFLSIFGQNMHQVKRFNTVALHA